MNSLSREVPIDPAHADFLADLLKAAGSPHQAQRPRIAHYPKLRVR
jgi:hypothetical protein